LRFDLFQCGLGIVRGQPPEPVQVLTDKRPAADTLRRGRDGQGPVTQVVRDVPGTFHQRAGQHNRRPQHHDQQDGAGQERRQLAASAKILLQLQVTRVGGNGNDHTPDDRYDERPDNVETPEYQQGYQGDADGGLERPVYEYLVSDRRVISLHGSVLLQG
jgi:hypothetical protein